MAARTEKRRRRQQGLANVSVSKESPHLEITGSLQSIDSKKTQRLIKFDVTCMKMELRFTTSGCSIPNSKAQKRPKFEWPKSTERKRPTMPFGHLAASFATGNSHQGKMRPDPNLRSADSSSHFYNMSSCLLLIFAASLLNIVVASHNLHGFKQSSAYHKDCLKRYGGIWMAQETWLSERQIPMLQQLGTQFVARSGMENAVSSGILTGRPFGGVCISWSPSLDHLISPLSNFRHKRIVGVELKSEEECFLFINVYMPFFNSSKRAECMTETMDCIAMIETMIEAHPLHKVIIGGDTNCELTGSSPFDPLWSDLLSRFDLRSCDSFYPPNSFTYCHSESTKMERPFFHQQINSRRRCYE